MKKRFILRNIVLSLMILIMIALGYLILVSTLPELMSLIKAGNFRRIQLYLKHQSTVEGLMCVGMMQILQIWTIVLSAIPMQVASGVIFGAVPSFIICSAATVIGMTISFLAWKYLSHILESIIPLLPKEEDMIRRALKPGTQPEFLLFLLCFVFVMPNGLIPIMAAKTNISMKKYIKSIIPGVSFNVLVCTLAGDRLLDGDFVAVAAVIILSTLIIGLAWKYQNTLLRMFSKS